MVDEDAKVGRTQGMIHRADCLLGEPIEDLEGKIRLDTTPLILNLLYPFTKKKSSYCFCFLVIGN